MLVCGFENSVDDKTRPQRLSIYSTLQFFLFIDKNVSLKKYLKITLHWLEVCDLQNIFKKKEIILYQNSNIFIYNNSR